MRPYAVHAGLELELQMEEKRTYRQNREQKPQRGEHKKEFPKREREDAPENMLEGRNAVTEALSAGRTIDKLFVADGDTDRALARICAMAKQAGAVVVPTDRRKLDYMSATGAHQGVIAMVAAHDYASIDDILKKAQDAGEPPLIVICDELSDPHNLGAIIRTAECAGAHGIIIPKRRSVGLTAVVGKASAGALEYMPVARVSNIAAAIDTLKKSGRVGLRYGGGGRHHALQGRPQKRCRHRHRQRGRGHEPPRLRALRLQGQYSHEGQHFIPQRIRCRGHHAL